MNFPGRRGSLGVAVAVLCLTACRTGDAQTANPGAPVEPGAEGSAHKPTAPQQWTVTIDTSGGFVGRGAGRVVVAHDGTTGFGPSCLPQITPADLEALSRAVAEAKPATWSPSYVRPSNPHGCCDQFRYTMTLDIRQADGTPEKYSTFWYSEMSEELPGNLRGLFDAAWKIKKDADAKCNKR